MNQDNRKFVEEMTTLQEKKKDELDRRGRRANELLERSEEVFSNNQEQWEAYQQCIIYQQEKMVSLIHELFIIQNILETTHQGDEK